MNRMVSHVLQNVLLSFYDKSKKIGDQWYILSAAWWVQWKGYVNYSEHNEKVKPNRRPGPIDNAPILDPKVPTQLQDELLEGDDYVAMNQKAWMFLHKCYGGGPVLQRFIVEENQVLAVELHPVVLMCYKANSAGLPDAKTKKKLVVSKGFETKKVIHRSAVLVRHNDYDYTSVISR
jgi:hypothetical protein